MRRCAWLIGLTLALGACAAQPLGATVPMTTPAPTGAVLLGVFVRFDNGGDGEYFWAVNRPLDD